jgi:hypothetical protein
MDDLNRVTGELAEIQDILAARSIEMPVDVVYHELGYSVDTGIEIMVKELNGRVVLITANADKNPAKVSFRGLDDHRLAVVLNEGQTLEIRDGGFMMDYQPFEVHIYALR